MIVSRIFRDAEVNFEPFVQKRNVMVNATQMAKIFGKEVKHFNENDSTKKFIESCLKSRNSDFLGVEKREDLIVSKQKSGTWMHRILALKFAAWLNPDFEVWVYMTIEELLFGHARATGKSISRTIELKSEMKGLMEKEEKTGGDFDRYLQIQIELAEEKNIRSHATRQQFQEMNDLFEEQKEIFN